MTTKLVLLRHGESIWNKENLFTGWTDVDLSDTGLEEADRGAKDLKEAGFTFVERNWRLNERHYGALQGLNKADTAKEYGPEQVHIWRRSYDVPPPPLSADDPRNPRVDPRYRDVDPLLLPVTECLKDTLERVMPYWNDVIIPSIKGGKKVIIAAHGNSLRALVKHLDHISDEDITGLNIPTGIPLVYELDEDCRAIRHYYLGDPKAAKAAAEKVAQQAKV